MAAERGATQIPPLQLPSEGLLLNERWRVIDEPQQWVLQVRKGGKRQRASGYAARAYCVSRTGLLLRIREYCGDVDPATWSLLESLPELHPDLRPEAP